MKKILLAVLSAILFFTSYSNDNNLKKRHGIKGLNEAMKENGKPNLYETSSREGFVFWENGEISDLNGNEVFNFSSNAQAKLCNDDSEYFYIAKEFNCNSPEQIYNFDGEIIVEIPVPNKVKFQLYNRILVLKEKLPNNEFVFGVYTVDGEEIVSLGTSWKETYSILSKYKGSEEIKRNINLILKFGTDQKESSEYWVQTVKDLGIYLGEYKNGQFNIIDIAKGGYIAKGIEGNVAESFLMKDLFNNYSAIINTRDDITYDHFQEINLKREKQSDKLKENGYPDLLGGFSFGCLCFFLKHESGQYHLVNLDGDVRLSADYICRINKDYSYGFSSENCYDNVLFVENFGGNSFFICFDTDPMNDKDIHRLWYNSYFGDGFLPEIPKAVRDAIQIPTIK